MKVIDPGHKYELSTLDGDGSPVVLTFVKRVGAKYPGNESAYDGTTLQETLRACLDRLLYLNRQIPDGCNQDAITGIGNAIIALEGRASERHGRAYNGSERLLLWPSVPEMPARGLRWAMPRMIPLASAGVGFRPACLIAVFKSEQVREILMFHYTS